MTDNVNGVGISTGYVTYTGTTKGNETPPENKKPETTADTPQKPQVAPDDVFAYYSALAAYNPSIKTSTYDVNKYVTPEQAARIAGFITSFEDNVTEALKIIEAEFGTGLSDAEKLAIAMAMAS